MHELNKKSIAIDFDGTITEYAGKYPGLNKFGKILPHCKNVINQLYDDGWHIIIYTCRGIDENIGEFLFNNGIKFDEIYRGHKDGNNHKPYAAVYLDDRGLKFDGDWQKAKNDISRFRAWWENEL